MTSNRSRSSSITVILYAGTSSTGDEQRDLELASDLLDAAASSSMKSRQQPVSTGALVLTHRLVSVSGGSQNRPFNGLSVAPLVVDMAFSLELYLETIALQHGNKLHGHELTKLFAKLPRAAKDAMVRQLALAQASQ